jgi:gluconate 2-dehydrogenase gamma chain
LWIAASQIIPTDETPGAREAGVIYFIDRALRTFEKDKQRAYVEGVRALDARARKEFPPAKNFSTLKSEEQIHVLKTIEKTDFFELLRTHTLMGFLADPSYGGNRDKTGLEADRV